MSEKVICNINDIVKLLPHRFPFLLVDRVEVIEEGKKARGIKNVTINEDYFNGHFPGNPIMPGVLILEALAQTGGVLMLRKPELKGKTVLFASIKEVKFRKPVIPGDQLILNVEITRWGGRVAVMKGEAYVGNDLVTEAEMTCVSADA
jgi:3-hydroxyacyl-[acyl-carrier-protein] dehydratase